MHDVIFVGARCAGAATAMLPGWALVGGAGCHKDPYPLGVCDALRDAELLGRGDPEATKRLYLTMEGLIEPGPPPA